MGAKKSSNPKPVLTAGAIYSGDNGRFFCGALKCAGMSAHFTGRGLSGAPVARVSPEDARSFRLALGKPPACEGCGKVYADPPTRTYFRKFRSGEVIALFPDVKEGHGYCSSYMHVGQHASASTSYTWCMTDPVTPEEYAPLKQELEGAPYFYNLKIVER